MFYLLLWWALLVLLGLAAFPVAHRFLARLPDRGYAFARPLALLLVVYPFWLLTSLGLLTNTFGAIALTSLLLAALAWGYTLWRPETESPLAWLRANWRHAVAVEIVFAIAFFAFAYYRAFNPEIQATEKPMEFMFLNSILKSPAFPPHDSWLSGYAISYYYLGYVIVAALTGLAAVPSNYAFNLGLIMTYALSATGAFGLVYNLVALDDAKSEESTGESKRGRQAPAYAAGILAVLLLRVIGNLEAPFESLHNAGIGLDSLYRALDVNGLAEAPRSGTLIPEDNWWWWRSSRVVNDHSPTTGEHVEVIDEFPSFSFLLGDLHPHVLALPFGLLALAVALNLVRRPAGLQKPWRETVRGWITPAMLLTAVILGSLSMLNTWDIATYGFVIVAALALSLFRAGGWSREAVLRAAAFGITLLVAGYILYLPFYLGFTSQAGGIVPTIVYKTPFQQYLMMFGIFVFIIASLVVVLARQRRSDIRRLATEIGTWVTASFAIPLIIALLGAVILVASGGIRDLVVGLLGLPADAPVLSTVGQVLRIYAVYFAYSLALFLLLAVLLASIIALARQRLEQASSDRELEGQDGAVHFVLLLAFTGLLLTLGVEFLYIRDTFGTRMNTVFKLYFQAWTLFAVAGAFGVYYVSRHLRGLKGTAWSAAFTLLLALSFVFPILAYSNRANGFQPSPQAGTPTLDGTLWIKNTDPDVYAGIQWLNSNAPPDSVILEAPGGSYTFTDQISMGTGLPTVVGWTGHELQWRGSGDVAGSREKDVETIYKTFDARQAGGLLQKYGVDYVIVGAAEKQKYGLTSPMIDKFGKLGLMVFSQGTMRIYQVGGSNPPLTVAP